MFDRERLQRLFRYGYSLTQDEQAAYDLLQDALETSLRKSPSDPQAATAYVQTIMRNRFIDQYRRAHRYPVVSLDEQDAQALDIDPSVLENIVIAEQDVEILMAALAPFERELLFFWAVEGYTAQEIAERTGSRRGTVLSRLHRIRQRLLAQWGSETSVQKQRGQT